MAKFNELNMPTYVPEDGKARFNCDRLRLSQIQNKPIEILACETDVVTRFGPRHLVKFRFKGDTKEYKFFTDCKEMKFHIENMKQMIQEKRDANIKDFVIETTITEASNTGGISVYQFN